MEAKWRLFLVLLLPLTKCEVTIVKTIGRGPDVTEICVNTPLSPIKLIVCKIRTERSGAECNLLYEPIEGFMQPCDSRFSLKTENQTVFLHLMNLTAEDSGNHTCECSYQEGTYIYHLNITVEGEDIKVSVQSQPHLDHLRVKIPAIWMEMTLMTLMTPTQPSNSQTVISTRVSLIQPAERRVLWRTRRDTAETDASCKLYANM
ncbi:Kinesin-like protein KIN-7G [Dissostichus eleginoides]|uniref:Kinesin-like protein KIN-7G n=1 Tax=Dissostichus eleginoides TaxID=100907 RepID=A0AAD9ESA5_DISEL|nr:Kinesin-like protein KIN-7G [Dissostichus eleginoides]